MARTQTTETKNIYAHLRNLREIIYHLLLLLPPQADDAVIQMREIVVDADVRDGGLAGGIAREDQLAVEFSNAILCSGDNISKIRPKCAVFSSATTSK